MTTETRTSSVGRGSRVRWWRGSSVLMAKCAWTRAPRRNDRARKVARYPASKCRGRDPPSLGADADLPGLRLPVPPDRRRRRALVPRPRRAPRRRRARGDLPHAPPVGRRATSRRSRACASSRSRAREALYGRGRQPPIGPPLRFGRGVLAHLLRHRRRYDAVHTVRVPVLLAARRARSRSPARAPGSASTGSRSGRGATGRATSAASRGRVGVAGAAPVRARDAAGVRVQPRCTRGGCAEEGLRGRAVRLGGLYAGPVEPPPAARADGEPARRLRRAPHRREARAERRAGGRWRRASGGPDLRGLVLGDGPERPDVLEAIARAGAEERRRGAGLRDRRGGARRARAARLPAAALAARGLRAGRHRGRRGRHAVASWSPGEDNAAAELVEDGVNGYVAASEAPRGPRRRDRCAASRAARRCAPRRPPGSPSARPSSRSPRSAERVVRGVRARDRGHRRARRRRGPGGPRALRARAARRPRALDDDGTRYRLYARDAGAAGRRASRGRASRLPDPLWHLAAAGARAAPCDVFLSTNSYLTAWFTHGADRGRRLRPRAVRRPERGAGAGRAHRARDDPPGAAARRARCSCISEATGATSSTASPPRPGERHGRPAGRRRRASPPPVEPAAAWTSPYVLAAGTLEPRKNLVRLIEAWAALPERGPRRATSLALVGPTGWDVEEIDAAAPRPQRRRAAARLRRRRRPRARSTPARPRSPTRRCTRASGCRCWRRWRRARRW